MDETHIQLEIVTPERLVLSETVDELVLPGSEGYLGVLPGHAPLLTSLRPGELHYVQNGRKRYLCVSAGFAEVLRNRVSVLAETCEWAEEIDVERARAARESARELLARERASETEFRAAEARLARALARIEVHGRVRG